MKRDHIIKEDLATMELKDINMTINLYYQGNSQHGRCYLPYEIFKGKTLLFSGSDYSPAPSINIDSVDAFVSLLAFICVKPGDTDPKYFAGYTQKQLAWSNSRHCENLSLMINDYENSDQYEDSEEREFCYNSAKDYFTSAVKIA